ncbi:MAG TPA: hypothetical protein VKS20_13285 [Candidatus Acidoferrales bacterium]|nr:hypothetical protein [Candidatus Acidoferrales bacterium]
MDVAGFSRYPRYGRVLAQQLRARIQRFPDFRSALSVDRPGRHSRANSVEHRERPDGSGDIVLMTNTLQRRGNNMVAPMKVGLCGVPNVKRVAEQVMALHAQSARA